MLGKGSRSMRKVGAQKYISLMRYVNAARSTQSFRLHPLIHTLPTVTLVQNVGGGSRQVSDHKLKYDMIS